MLFVSPIVPVVPMRAEASHRSEMTSQFLFGESAELLEKYNGFYKVRLLHDGYEGWCQANQMHEVSEFSLLNGSLLLNGDPFGEVAINDSTMYIPFGLPLFFFENGEAEIGSYKMKFEGNYLDPLKSNFNEETIRSLTTKYLNTSYLWGGRTIYGIDCSGFTQQIFKFLNIKLPRDAYQQASLGEIVGFLQEATCGDLAFFDNAEGKITHVGIMLDGATIIHASGKVRVDDIDNYGIISRDTGERTHQLRIIKRYQ